MNGEIFSIIAPVFFAASVGFAWRKLGLPYDTALVTRLLINVTTPCLVFSRLGTLEIPIETFGIIAASAAASIFIFAAFGFLALKLLKVPMTVGLGPIIFPNCGNMGLALSLFAFGDSGLALGLSFFVISATAQFTLAPWLASGRFSAAQVVRAPLIYVTVLSVIVLLTGTQIPTWLLNTTHLLGDVSIPLMLITLGVSLASFSISNLRSSIIIAVLRLTIGFGGGILLAGVLGLTGVEKGIVILMCSMPSAVFNYLFAEKYGGRAQEVAGAVVLSTAISFATLPLLLAFLLR